MGDTVKLIWTSKASVTDDAGRELRAGLEGNFAIDRAARLVANGFAKHAPEAPEPKGKKAKKAPSLNTGADNEGVKDGSD